MTLRKKLGYATDAVKETATKAMNSSSEKSKKSSDKEKKNENNASQSSDKEKKRNSAAPTNGKKTASQAVLNLGNKVVDSLVDSYDTAAGLTSRAIDSVREITHELTDKIIQHFVPSTEEIEALKKKLDFYLKSDCGVVRLTDSASKYKKSVSKSEALKLLLNNRPAYIISDKSLYFIDRDMTQIKIIISKEQLKDFKKFFPIKNDLVDLGKDQEHLEKLKELDALPRLGKDGKQTTCGRNKNGQLLVAIADGELFYDTIGLNEQNGNINTHISDGSISSKIINEIIDEQYQNLNKSRDEANHLIPKYVKLTTETKIDDLKAPENWDVHAAIMTLAQNLNLIKKDQTLEESKDAAKTSGYIDVDDHIAAINEKARIEAEKKRSGSGSQSPNQSSSPSSNSIVASQDLLQSAEQQDQKVRDDNFPLDAPSFPPDFSQVDDLSDLPTDLPPPLNQTQVIVNNEGEAVFPLPPTLPLPVFDAAVTDIGFYPTSLPPFIPVPEQKQADLDQGQLASSRVNKSEQVVVVKLPETLEIVEEPLVDKAKAARLRVALNTLVEFVRVYKENNVNSNRWYLCCGLFSGHGSNGRKWAENFLNTLNARKLEVTDEKQLQQLLIDLIHDPRNQELKENKGFREQSFKTYLLAYHDYLGRISFGENPVIEDVSAYMKKYNAIIIESGMSVKEEFGKVFDREEVPVEHVNAPLQ